MDVPARTEARGLPVRFHPHALEEIYKEGCTEEDAADVLERPQHDAKGTAFGRKKGKTLIVRYRHRETYLYVHGFSATRRKLGPL